MTGITLRSSDGLGLTMRQPGKALQCVIALVGMVVAASCGAPGSTVPQAESSSHPGTASTVSPSTVSSMSGITNPRMTAALAKPCSASSLDPSVLRGGAEGPTAGLDLAFTNHSTSVCKVTGWPTVVGVTESGTMSQAHNVGTSQFGPNVSGVPVVVLAPGERADAVVTGSPMSGTGGSCGPPYWYLRVAPPGGDGTIEVSGWLNGLGAYFPSCTGLHVSMVVPSANIYHG